MYIGIDRENGRNLPYKTGVINNIMYLHILYISQISNYLLLTKPINMHALYI